MKLILDCRETNLLKFFEMLIKTTDKFKNIKISTENLLIGDISINEVDNESKKIDLITTKLFKNLNFNKRLKRF